MHDKIFKIFFIFFVLFLFSFTSIRSQCYEKVTLQPHQKFVVDYLIKNKNQKGLLINHSLGSGKTYLSLAVSEYYANKKVYILLPRFLKSNWITQIESFGVNDRKRYHMFAFREWDQIKEIDFKKSIVIVDEAHKLVDGIRFKFGKISSDYSNIFKKISDAEKILILTGTPIYNDITDLAYLGNLISGQNLFPLNPERFKSEYTDIKSGVSLTRGYFSESKMVMSYLPLWGALSIITLVGATQPHIALLAALGINVAIPFGNAQFPANKTQFREFNPEKLEAFAKKYFSFYEIPLKNSSDYPDKEIIISETEYSRPQLNFFMNFADEDLSSTELKRLLKSSSQKYEDSYIELNSAAIQKRFLAEPGAGRDIGNLVLQGAKGKMIYPKKFIEILEYINQSSGQVAIYSNYYENGIQEFANFLNHHNHKNSYVILHPDESIPVQIEKLNQYNSGSKKIVMIHPEITEGISLKGTRQFHILEPVKNSALLHQIIGRAVRYKSHAHLPPEKRLVKIYLWEVKLNYTSIIPNEASAMRRRHWQKRFAEVNPNLWTKGITELDRNYFRKDDSPDTLTSQNSDFVQRDSESFREFIKMYSIESD